MEHKAQPIWFFMSNICVNGDQGEETERMGIKKCIWKIMAENFPNCSKTSNHIFKNFCDPKQS